MGGRGGDGMYIGNLYFPLRFSVRKTKSVVVVRREPFAGGWTQAPHWLGVFPASSISVTQGFLASLCCLKPAERGLNVPVQCVPQASELSTHRKGLCETTTWVRIHKKIRYASPLSQMPRTVHQMGASYTGDPAVPSCSLGQLRPHRPPCLLPSPAVQGFSSNLRVSTPAGGLAQTHTPGPQPQGSSFSSSQWGPCTGSAIRLRLLSWGCTLKGAGGERCAQHTEGSQ